MGLGGDEPPGPFVFGWQLRALNHLESVIAIQAIYYEWLTETQENPLNSVRFWLINPFESEQMK
jgi:hypothetical protein